MVIFQATFQLTTIVISFQIIVICNLKEKKVKKIKKIIQITKFNVKNSKLTINELIDINVRYRQII